MSSDWTASGAATAEIEAAVHSVIDDEGVLETVEQLLCAKDGETFADIGRRLNPAAAVFPSEEMSCYPDE